MVRKPGLPDDDLDAGLEIGHDAELAPVSPNPAPPPLPKARAETAAEGPPDLPEARRASRAATRKLDPPPETAHQPATVSETAPSVGRTSKTKVIGQTSPGSPETSLETASQAPSAATTAAPVTGRDPSGQVRPKTRLITPAPPADTATSAMTQAERPPKRAPRVRMVPEADSPQMADPQAETQTGAKTNAKIQTPGAPASTRMLAPDVARVLATPGDETTPLPVGWLVITEGPGRGAVLTLASGLSTLGQGPGNRLRLDFGDPGISQGPHLQIAYDPETAEFLISNTGQPEIIRLDGMALLQPSPLSHGAEIHLSQTRLRFAAFCGPAFDWSRT